MAGGHDLKVMDLRSLIELSAKVQQCYPAGRGCLIPVYLVRDPGPDLFVRSSFRLWLSTGLAEIWDEIPFG